tara:strand:- start:49442 stop:49891 length:450 start_codon:yes stop_codon:yes gene_type:complete
MVAYNFHVDHARAIIFGAKASAIKPHGKRPHVAPDGLVHAFCGAIPPLWMKSPDCHKLIVAPCSRSDEIVIAAERVTVGGVLMCNPDWFATLAREEGFADFGSLQAHYHRLYGLPFTGQYIRWRPDKAEFRAQWPLIVKPPEVDGDDTE